MTGVFVRKKATGAIWYSEKPKSGHWVKTELGCNYSLHTQQRGYVSSNFHPLTARKWKGKFEVYDALNPSLDDRDCCVCYP